ncbi:unnamed protein product [Notodromas monacha]|uniref:Cell cycle control protein n=1 Tax=Notodromas monacha TaxID=399045 RepID=A0A7R9BSQ4_9CRUS|nr:unnamed protein product [Notodromas monacha]CAG0919625.1 unnamed protein product [Notodromas monacha]
MPNGANNRPSMRPRGRAIEQQRLPAWQPILTAGTVLPTFFVIGIAFIPVGVGLLYFSNGVQHFELDYTYCKTSDGKTCADKIAEAPGSSCECKIQFNITDSWKGKVYVYYGLTNFYQNHRRYVKSRDDFQLLGDVKKTPDQECRPFAFQSLNATYKEPIVPCGAIANSMFNDTFQITFSNSGKEVKLLKTGLAWESDKRIKFANPSGFDPANASGVFLKTQKPINWQKPIYNLGLNEPGNQGLVNEDFIVWMRNAAFPNFRKLYAIVSDDQEFFRYGFAAGNYELTVSYTFPVTKFDGTKRLMLSTTSLLGGKNPFLGIAYIVVGCLFLVTGIVFIFVHIKYGKTTQEMISVTPQTPY